MTARETRGAGPGLADGVELVDEDDAGRLLLGLLEEIAHARGSDTDEHLHELGAREEKERHVGLARDSPGQERLARARGADQQHALGDASAQPLVLLGVLEEVHHLHELRLGLLHARDVGKRRLELLPVVDLGFGAAEGQRLGRPPAHPAHDEHPEADHQSQRHDPPEDEVPPERAFDAPGELDLVLLELLDEGAVLDAGDPGGREGGDEAADLVTGAGLRGGEGARLQRAPDLAVGDGDALDLALAHERQELAHRDLDRPRRQEPALDEGQHQHGNEQIDERELRFLLHGEFHRGALALMLAEAPGPVKLRRVRRLRADFALLHLVTGHLVGAHEVVLPDLDGQASDLLVAVKEREPHPLDVIPGGERLGEESPRARLIREHRENLHRGSVRVAAGLDPLDGHRETVDVRVRLDPRYGREPPEHRDAVAREHRRGLAIHGQGREGGVCGLLRPDPHGGVAVVRRLLGHTLEAEAVPYLEVGQAVVHVIGELEELGLVLGGEGAALGRRVLFDRHDVIGRARLRECCDPRHGSHGEGRGYASTRHECGGSSSG